MRAVLLPFCDVFPLLSSLTSPSLRLFRAVLPGMFACLVLAGAAHAYETARGFIFPVGTEWKRPGDGNEYSILQNYCVWNGYAPGYHTGVDLGNGQEGGWVKSIANGKIVEKRWSDSWGNTIVVEHRLLNGEIWYSRYGHMQNNSLTDKLVNDAVQMGESIGKVGNTGWSSAPHLHLQICDAPGDPGYISNSACTNNGYREPLQFIRDRLFEQESWYYWNFDGTNDKEGWVSFGDCGWSVGLGNLVQCQGSDPRLISPYMHRTPDANFYIKIEGANTGSRSDGELFLQTESYGFNATNRMAFTFPNGGGWNQVVIRLRDVPGYASGGVWRQFRIDPVGASGGGNTFVNFIRYSSDSEGPTITSASVNPSGWSSTNSFTASGVGWDGPDDGSGSGSGIDHYEVSKNGGDWVGQGLNTSWTGTASVQCANTLDIRGVDRMGTVGPTRRVTFYYDSTAPGVPGPVASLSHTKGVWSTDRTVDVTWTSSSDGCGSGVSGYGVEWSASASTVPAPVQTNTGPSDTSPSLADGMWYVHIRARDSLDQWSGKVTDGTFWIDNTAPSPPTNLNSPSHSTGVCSADQTVEICWNAATDGAGSGVTGYSWQWSTSPSTTPDDSIDPPSCVTSNPLPDGSWYFHIRARDGIGLWSSTVHYGPFCIDTGAPSAVSGLQSASHMVDVWSNDATVEIDWEVAAGGASGIAGYSYLWTRSPTDEPDNQVETTNLGTTSPSLGDAADWYFRIRAVSGTGVAGITSSLGPFMIDTAPPGVSVVAPNGGEEWQTGEVRTIEWSAQDALSGVETAHIYYSTDGSEPDSLIASVDTLVTFDWTIPDNPSEQAMLKVVVSDLAGNTAEDASDGVFTLLGLDWDIVLTGATAYQGFTFGASWLECNNDAFPDLFLSTSAGHVMLVSDGTGGFTSSTPAALQNVGVGRSAVWGDIDNDGDDDVFLANVGPNKAFINDGIGTFTPMNGPFEGNDISFGSAWVDLDADGNLDLAVVAGDTNPIRLWWNDGGGRALHEITSLTPQNEMGVAIAWCDFDLDGDQDFYVSNWALANRLYQNQGGTFTDIATGDVADEGQGQGVAWGDYDNDGDFDLFLVNYGGECRLFNNSGGTFAAASMTSLGVTAGYRGLSVADFDNDSDLDVILGSQEGCRYLRNDAGTVVDATTAGIAGLLKARGLACADYDNDGDVDVYVARENLPNALVRNTAGSRNNWLKVRLVGTHSNRSAVGARVILSSAGVRQLRQVTAGTGYLSQDERVVHFGLGAATTVDTITVCWPSGMSHDTTAVTCNQTIILEEPVATAVEAVASSLYRLQANYPNPFNPMTQIRYELPAASEVTLVVFNVRGQHVTTLVDRERQGPGAFEARWDGTDASGAPAASGVYFYRIRVGSWTMTRKMVLLK